MNRKALIILAILGLCPGLPGAMETITAEAPTEKVSLAGHWKLQLDRNDVGIDQEWFSKSLEETIDLPGVLQAQGFGDDVSVETPWTGKIVDQSFFEHPRYEKYRRPGHVKVPFWLQPEKYYKGVAWYQKEVEIVSSWKGSRVVLTLERPHWETRVWIDDQFIGSDRSLSTPHVYDLGTQLQPGEHLLSVRVDNRMIVDIGANSHSITDHTQGNWNGIVGQIHLSRTPPVWIDDLQAFPNVEGRSVAVHGKLGNVSSRSGAGLISLSVQKLGRSKESSRSRLKLPVEWSPSGGSFKAVIEMGENAQLWSELTPQVYELTATLEHPRHSKRLTFGMREIETFQTQFILNGQKVFLRGTLECAIFPLTGHPPTDVASWLKVIRAAKAHGLNHIRFHSWCPPEAAFQAADELGFYFQVECSSWANGGATLGDGRPVDDWLYEEAGRILSAYGNHPSFILMAYGNEPGGNHHKDYLGKWVDHFRNLDDRRLYTGGSGWPEIPENEFHVSPKPRIQRWGEGLKSRINALPPETVTDYRGYVSERNVPVISHEIGQWCVYPNFDEIAKYRGYLKPKNFEIFRETLEMNHMLDQARDFLLASGKLQALCYKEDIESALRTPGMGGFQLLDLHDFPGQGTALVGILDPFWEEKGYIRPEEFRRFCDTTVLLARIDKRVFTNDEIFEADLEIAHFGSRALLNARFFWRVISEEGREVGNGFGKSVDIFLGNGIELGSIRLPLAGFEAPRRYRLEVGIENTSFENDWDFWVYPPSVDIKIPPELEVLTELDSDAIELLNEGGIVMWLVPPDQVSGDQTGTVATGFSSIFWNTSWTRRQAPHTLGILCDPKHPALSRFPTEFHSNWQWWYLVSQSQAMILDQFPKELRPIIQMIDDWFTNRRLGMAFEVRVGEGKLLVCSIDLMKGIQENPVARQMLHSLCSYMISDEFSPETNVDPSVLRELAVLEQVH